MSGWWGCGLERYDIKPSVSEGSAIRIHVIVGGCLVECGQVSADVLTVGDAEVGVEGERLLPVVAGQAGIAGGEMGVGETVVGAGLFVAVADFGGQGKCGGVLDECRGKLPGDVPDLTEVVEGVSFAGRVADLLIKS